MEPNEDSIKLLEMRIRHQMNRSLEKKIMPENIHYYLSSSATQRLEELQQDIHSDEQGEPRQMIHVDGKGNLWQEIQSGERAAQQSGILTDGTIGQRPDTQTDGKMEALQAAYGGETGPAGKQEYEDLPFDASEYIDKVGEMSQRIEHIEISETKEVQHAKARNGYESARRSMDAEQSSGIGKKHFFDAKG